MKLKKWLLSGLTLLTGLSLAACGNSSGEGDSAASDGPVEIEYWYPNADTQGGQTVTELINEFNESQDEVHVTGVFQSGMYQGLMQNLQTNAAAGQVPALVQIGWSYREYFANNFEYSQPQEIIDNLSTEDSSFITDKFEENIYSLATANDDSQVGLPYSLSVPVIYLNMDILNEAGVNKDDLKTWEDIREAAQTISENTDHTGLYIQEAEDNWNIQSMVESNGSQMLKDGKAAFADDKGKETYQFYQDMVEEGSAIHASGEDGQQAFISGNIGMWHQTIAQRTNVMNNANFEAVAIPSPAFEGEEINKPAGGSMLVVTAQDDDQQLAAWKFMKFLYEPDNIAAWTKGTGYVPPTKDASDNEELQTLIKDDKIFPAAYANLENLVPWAPFPGNSGMQAEQMLIDLKDRVLGGADVDTEVQKTQDEINQLIK
ncbi:MULTISPECIES: ABC transporter substrate-binding protein [Aerococcus]|uniref:ABC transporter substrate-binding protein n=1 Tax=Aerococcus TaxID=1375 RepID=UPI000DCD9148|nr:ABC transporter substrate-binding protein [Aerococcus urinae]RAV95354.1 ABC transporter substrate-binding protein [Aerococcus mictus]MDK6291622.1 ABC transporter substrate-binding protein [Aerococcus urinae]MDK6374363.1 ABC transporter substrate-binding protein [Aerococcus urinae]MDK6421032.1 ABC transporter substrate-binding protein [Aerococcus urinae]MDK8074999.1 ABC transporter substrate-binding protein [Aerococcus urinae]